MHSRLTATVIQLDHTYFLSFSFSLHVCVCLNPKGSVKSNTENFLIYLNRVAGCLFLLCNPQGHRTQFKNVKTNKSKAFFTSPIQDILSTLSISKPLQTGTHKQIEEKEELCSELPTGKYKEIIQLGNLHLTTITVIQIYLRTPLAITLVAEGLRSNTVYTEHSL